MKKTKLWIPAHGFVRDLRAQWMSYVISCHKSVLLFGKLVLSVSFFLDSREGKCPFWVRERECVKAAKSILVFLVKNWEVWKKEQRNFKYVGESKRVKNIRPDYLCITLNLIDDWLKSSSAKQERPYTNYCYLRGLDSIAECQRIFEITMKSTPHHALSLPSFIQFISCGVNEILSFCFLENSIKI